MKQKVLLVLKGILLYTTIILAILWISSIDNICETALFIPLTLIIAGLSYACYKTISMEELDILCLGKYLKTQEDKDNLI